MLFEALQVYIMVPGPESGFLGPKTAQNRCSQIFVPTGENPLIQFSEMSGCVKKKAARGIVSALANHINVAPPSWWRRLRRRHAWGGGGGAMPVCGFDLEEIL